MTECTVYKWFQRTCLEIEVSYVVIHKANQPDIIVNFLDDDRLAGQGRAEVDFFVTETDSADATQPVLRVQGYTRLAGAFVRSSFAHVARGKAFICSANQRVIGGIFKNHRDD